MNHVIDHLDVELTLSGGSTASAFEAQEAVRRFLRGEALRVIEAVFDGFGAAGEVWRFERLELDLGLIEGPDLHGQWARRLREALQRALAAQRERMVKTSRPGERAGAGAGDEAAAPARRYGRHQAGAATLLHFALHGCLPWNLVLPRGQRLADWADEVLAHDARTLVRGLRGAGVPPAACLRLAGQLSPKGREHLLRAAGLPRDWPLAAWVDAAAARVPAGAPRDPAAGLRQRLWAALLAQALREPVAAARPRRLQAALRQAARAAAGPGAPDRPGGLAADADSAGPAPLAAPAVARRLLRDVERLLEAGPAAELDAAVRAGLRADAQGLCTRLREALAGVRERRRLAEALAPSTWARLLERLSPEAAAVLLPLVRRPALAVWRRWSRREAAWTAARLREAALAVAVLEEGPWQPSPAAQALAAQAARLFGADPVRAAPALVQALREAGIGLEGAGGPGDRGGQDAAAAASPAPTATGDEEGRGGPTEHGGQGAADAVSPARAGTGGEEGDASRHSARQEASPSASSFGRGPGAAAEDPPSRRIPSAETPRLLHRHPRAGGDPGGPTPERSQGAANRTGSGRSAVRSADGQPGDRLRGNDEAEKRPPVLRPAATLRLAVDGRGRGPGFTSAEAPLREASRHADTGHATGPGRVDPGLRRDDDALSLAHAAAHEALAGMEQLEARPADGALALLLQRTLEAMGSAPLPAAWALRWQALCGRADVRAELTAPGRESLLPVLAARLAPRETAFLAGWLQAGVWPAEAGAAGAVPRAATRPFWRLWLARWAATPAGTDFDRDAFVAAWLQHLSRATGLAPGSVLSGLLARWAARPSAPGPHADGKGAVAEAGVGVARPAAGGAPRRLGAADEAHPPSAPRHRVSRSGSHPVPSSRRRPGATGAGTPPGPALSPVGAGQATAAAGVEAGLRPVLSGRRWRRPAMPAQARSQTAPTDEARVLAPPAGHPRAGALPSGESQAPLRIAGHDAGRPTTVFSTANATARRFPRTPRGLRREDGAEGVSPRLPRSRRPRPARTARDPGWEGDVSTPPSRTARETLSQPQAEPPTPRPGEPAAALPSSLRADARDALERLRRLADALGASAGAAGASARAAAAGAAAPGAALPSTAAGAPALPAGAPAADPRLMDRPRHEPDESDAPDAAEGPDELETLLSQVVQADPDAVPPALRQRLRALAASAQARRHWAEVLAVPVWTRLLALLSSEAAAVLTPLLRRPALVVWRRWSGLDRAGTLARLREAALAVALREERPTASCLVAALAAQAARRFGADPAVAGPALVAALRDAGLLSVDPAATDTAPREVGSAPAAPDSHVPVPEPAGAAQGLAATAPEGQPAGGLAGTALRRWREALAGGEAASAWSAWQDAVALDPAGAAEALRALCAQAGPRRTLARLPRRRQLRLVAQVAPAALAVLREWFGPAWPTLQGRGSAAQAWQAWWDAWQAQAGAGSDAGPALRCFAAGWLRRAAPRLPAPGSGPAGGAHRAPHVAALLAAVQALEAEAAALPGQGQRPAAVRDSGASGPEASAAPEASARVEPFDALGTGAAEALQRLPGISVSPGTEAPPPADPAVLLRLTLSVRRGALPRSWQARWRALCGRGSRSASWLASLPPATLAALAARLAPGEAGFPAGWSAVGVWPAGLGAGAAARERSAFWTLWLARWAATPAGTDLDQEAFAEAWLRRLSRASGLGREQALRGLLERWTAAGRGSGMAGGRGHPKLGHSPSARSSRTPLRHPRAGAALSGDRRGRAQPVARRDAGRGRNVVMPAYAGIQALRPCAVPVRSRRPGGWPHRDARVRALLSGDSQEPVCTAGCNARRQRITSSFRRKPETTHPDTVAWRALALARAFRSDASGRVDPGFRRDDDVSSTAHETFRRHGFPRTAVGLRRDDEAGGATSGRTAGHPLPSGRHAAPDGAAWASRTASVTAREVLARLAGAAPGGPAVEASAASLERATASDTGAVHHAPTAPDTDARPSPAVPPPADPALLLRLTLQAPASQPLPLSWLARWQALCGRPGVRAAWAATLPEATLRALASRLAPGTQDAIANLADAPARAGRDTGTGGGADIDAGNANANAPAGADAAAQRAAFWTLWLARLGATPLGGAFDQRGFAQAWTRRRSRAGVPVPAAHEVRPAQHAPSGGQAAAPGPRSGTGPEPASASGRRPMAQPASGAANAPAGAARAAAWPGAAPDHAFEPPPPGNWTREERRVWLRRLRQRPLRLREPVEDWLSDPRAADRAAADAPAFFWPALLRWLRPEACDTVLAAARAALAAGVARPALVWREVLQHLFVEGRRHVGDAFGRRLGQVLAGRRAPAVLGRGARAAGVRPAAPAPAAAPSARPAGGLSWPGASASAQGLAEGQAVTVGNAGLVLLGPYVPRLFTMLGLASGPAFADAAATDRGVHLLQWLVDARGDAAEHELVLNKLLCGLALAVPVAAQAWPSAPEQATGEQMLKAVVAHWSALGKTSVAGLRETFLQREGRLLREAGAWRLRVAPRAFDMLLDRIPWGWRTLKLPWMPEVLHVEWR